MTMQKNSLYIKIKTAVSFFKKIVPCLKCMLVFVLQRKVVAARLLLWALSLTFLAWGLLPVQWSSESSGEFNERKLLIEYAPKYSNAKVIGGMEALTGLFPAKLQIDPERLSLVGNNPFDHFYHAITNKCRFIVYGKLWSIDQIAGTSSAIPSFYVYRWEVARYVPQIFAKANHGKLAPFMMNGCLILILMLDLGLLAVRKLLHLAFSQFRPAMQRQNEEEII